MCPQLGISSPRFSPGGIGVRELMGSKYLNLLTNSARFKLCSIRFLQRKLVGSEFGSPVLDDWASSSAWQSCYVYCSTVAHPWVTRAPRGRFTGPCSLSRPLAATAADCPNLLQKFTQKNSKSWLAVRIGR